MMVSIKIMMVSITAFREFCGSFEHISEPESVNRRPLTLHLGLEVGEVLWILLPLISEVVNSCSQF